MSILIAIIVFSFLVITHELGHFLMAKRAGIGVTEFSVGMGPRLLKVEKGGTLYSLKAIPFGGSCLMVGEDEDDDSPDSFQKKSVWARISVVAGGPVFNFIFAFLLALIIVGFEGTNPAVVTSVSMDYGAGEAGIQVGDKITAINGERIAIGRDVNLYFLKNPMDGSLIEVTYERGGEEYTTKLDPNYASYRFGISYMATEVPAELTEITAESPAAEAGIKAGDIVVSINGTSIDHGLAMKEYFSSNPMDGSPVNLVLDRAGELLELTVVPEYYETQALGMVASSYREDAGIFGTVWGAVQEVGYGIKTVLASLKMLFTGAVSVTEMSGPVGIVSIIDSTVETSKTDGLYYVFLNVASLSVLLSANLGVFNLLPIPALDGGRLVFLIIEAIRRKPLPPDKEGIVHTIGFILLMGLMVFVLFNDIFRIFAGG